MAKTINRTPSFFDSQKLDEKYSNLNTFAGICGNKNYLGIDQTTFEDANNMYIDQDAQLSSRPPIKQVAFVNGVIIKIYKINSLVVYHTLDADKYYIHFKFEENWYSREVTEKINITWWDKRYVVFTEDEIIGFTYDYYTDTITWYDTEAMIYIPITELVSGSVRTDKESENALTTKKIIRYIFRVGITTVTTELVGKNVTIDMDGEKFEIIFVKNNEKVFTKSIGTFNATDIQSSMLGNFLAFAPDGNMYYSLDGALFYEIDRPADVKPFMSDDGLALYAIYTPDNASNGVVYYLSLNVTSPSQIPSLTWTNYDFNIAGDNLNSYSLNHWASGSYSESSPYYIRHMSSMTFTSIKFRKEPYINPVYTVGFETFGHSYEVGQAVFIASFEATANCINNKGNDYLDYFDEDDKYWGGNTGPDGTAVTLYGHLLVLLFNGVITIRLVDYDDNIYIIRTTTGFPGGKVKFLPLTTTNNVVLNSLMVTFVNDGYANTRLIILNGTMPLGRFNAYMKTVISPSKTYYIPYKNIFIDSISPSLSFFPPTSDETIMLENEFDISSAFLTDSKIHTLKVAFNYKNDLVYSDVLISQSIEYSLDEDYQSIIYYNQYEYDDLSPSTEPKRQQNPAIVEPVTSPNDGFMPMSIFTSDRTPFKLGETTLLTNKYFRIYKQNIPLLSTTNNLLPLYCDDTRIIYYDKVTHKIYDSSGWTEVHVDLLQSGSNRLFIPYVFGVFTTNVVADKNKVYISSAKEGRLYLPINDVLSFADEITNFATFSQTSLGIFSENEVHELQYDNGGYRLSLTKLQLGCKKDSDILLNYDGKTIFLTTLKGLNALNYQDFVQSTEYVYNYLTENIMSMYDQYAKSPIKLYQFKNWLFMYRQDADYLFLFDLRNSSWWKWTNIANIKQILFDGDKLLLVINGDLFEYDFNATEYIDDVGQRIDWMFRSQKLHFSAPNNYKQIKSVSIITPQEEETTLRYKMEFRNYRDLTNLTETDVFERDVDLLSTVIKKVNFIKTNAFQFSVMNDIKNPVPRKFLTPNIAIKYRITERLR